VIASYIVGPAGEERVGATLLEDGAAAMRGANAESAEASAYRVLHGNSLDSPRLTQGYTLRDLDTGAILKYGDTSRGSARYSKRYLEKNNAEMVFEASGSKREMHSWQHEKIIEYRAVNGDARPPLNKPDY